MLLFDFGSLVYEERYYLWTRTLSTCSATIRANGPGLITFDPPLPTCLTASRSDHRMLSSPDVEQVEMLK